MNTDTMHKAGDPMLSAAERVSAIIELAESILIDVDTQDLFVLQRVSRTFRHIITGSKLLLQKCYLLDDPD